MTLKLGGARPDLHKTIFRINAIEKKERPDDGSDTDSFKTDDSFED